MELKEMRESKTNHSLHLCLTFLDNKCCLSVRSIEEGVRKKTENKVVKTVIGEQNVKRKKIKVQ